MKTRIRNLFVAAAWLGAAAMAPAASVEWRQEGMLYAPDEVDRGINMQQPGGVSQPAEPTPTVNQFRSVTFMGGHSVPLNSAGLDPSRTFVRNAKNVNFQRAENADGSVAAVHFVQIGAPYMARQVDFRLADVIEPPGVDEANDLLPPGTDPNTYWNIEPHTVDNHASGEYHWSPHARRPFASQPGRISVIWKKRVPETPPAGYNPADYSNEGGNFFRLFQKFYTVSLSPAQTARKIYWTQGRFGRTGAPVDVPEGRVGAVNVIYNTTFPARVAAEYVDPFAQPLFLPEDNPVQEKRTLWYDRELGQIYAYNREGRVLVEMLGETASDGINRVFLGMEVVDVIQQPTAVDIVTELGEPLWPEQTRDDLELVPELAGTLDSPYVYREDPSGSDRPIFHAIRETTNPNDLFLHWRKAGVADLLWPNVYARYQLVWPTATAKYSHYVRPEVASEIEAAATAIALPTINAPQIAYQDRLDRPRAVLNGEFKFYTHLDRAQPVHRTLLQFLKDGLVRFERVYSWLDIGLIEPQRLTGTLAAGLDEYVDEAGNERFDFPVVGANPRVVNEIALVGERIKAPAGESGSGADEDYLAGHIDIQHGNLYNQAAYIDPLGPDGFVGGNEGAIIPVNTIPGNNALEVHWFRSNGIDPDTGFEPIYWPEVIGRYTLQWPASPAEVILASNDGSGALPSLQAKGSVYVQNDRNLIGFNPNEEHSVMVGGQMYALRDDLNVTAGDGYTSERFALLNYTEADNRPAMRVFKVRREAPELGITFNYEKLAGQVLQAPMPLPILPKPIPTGEKNAINEEVDVHTVAVSRALTGDTVSLTIAADHLLQPFRRYTLQNLSNLGERRWLISLGADYASRSVTAIPSAQSPLLLTRDSDLTFHINRPSGLTGGESVIVVAEGFQAHYTVTVSSVTDTSVTLDPGSPAGAANATLLVIPDATVVANQFDGWRLSPELLPNIPSTVIGPKNIDIRPRYAKYTFQDRKNDIWVYRGPHGAGREGGFEMQWYYKTQPGFFYPSLALDAQPPAGTITPYLRAKNPDGSYYGDPVYANAASDQSLPIAYNPVWPDTTPEMFMAESLMSPKRGLPAMRGNTSLEIFYEQSRAEEIPAPKQTAILHDATREKQLFLTAEGSPTLFKIPDSALVETFQGNRFFPLLPPHLAKRFFFDPNRGAFGALVFKGEFVDEILGDDYLHLNVLGSNDRALLKSLVADSDQEKSKWDSAIDALSTKMETFYENPARAGEYIPNTSWDRTVGSGNLAGIEDDDTAVDSYSLSSVGPGHGYISLIAGNGEAFTPVDEPVSVLILKVNPQLYRGEVKVITPENPLSERLTLQQVVDLAAKTEDYVFEWRYAAPVDGFPPAVAFSNADPGAQWLVMDPSEYPELVRANWGGSASVKTLADNYIIMRYGQKDILDADGDQNVDEIREYTAWTDPVLAEGWIKRVLAGINPFNQRVTDLFNNQINTSGSVLEQAGTRWEGDVALSLDAVNQAGLIEIYETVLRRGRGLSIDADINYGPANDALLLAAGYINDLYMIVGNEAFADAANPTIGISTASEEFGDVATAQFAFSGQVPTLLEEELGLLRGRDDFALPGVELTPVYNRLVWNYTRGINSGEIIYALNYNIKDDQGDDIDGAIGAEDAARMFPQGHGDAYGHYLTASKGYYSLLIDEDFDWVPRVEAVNVLGKPVTVDYFDERKFAAAASALARVGNQVVDLTWRKDFQRGADSGWEHFGETRENNRRQLPSTRYWGVDHWAARTGQGTFLNWVVGNAILPEVDPDPAHEGVQKVDRTTVPELGELVTLARSLQTSVDDADAHKNPLGMSENSVAFDITPNGFGTGETSHFDQIQDRAKVSLKNAVTAFNDAKDVTRLMRTEQDSLVDIQADVAAQELAYTHRLIELFGTPYPDDIGPGKTYSTGYAGPDLIHYSYVDLVELNDFPVVDPTQATTFKLDIQTQSDAYRNLPTREKVNLDFISSTLRPVGDSSISVIEAVGVPGWVADIISAVPVIGLGAEIPYYSQDQSYDNNTNAYIEFTLDSHGFFSKPSNWQSRRASPGQIQSAISDIIMARNLAHEAMGKHQLHKYKLDRAIEDVEHMMATQQAVLNLRTQEKQAQAVITAVEFAESMVQKYIEYQIKQLEKAVKALAEAIPDSTIAGVAAGGDLTAPAKAAVKKGGSIGEKILNGVALALEYGYKAHKVRVEKVEDMLPVSVLEPLEQAVGNVSAVREIDQVFADIQANAWTINLRLQELDEARRKYRALIAEGDRIQAERQAFRQKAAGLIQGYRTRDAAFRVFRNEKLERYKSMFDLAARYTYLAAQAFDYETGLLHTDEGKAFIERIVQSRALGVMLDGEPQFGGSNNGDPGLSSVLAEMAAEWQVLRGRLGINNPDANRTLASLRLENHRILPGAEGDDLWKDILENARMDNILEDADVRRYCLQIDPGDELPVPGIVLEFSTVILDKMNLFGQQAAAGDHTFSPSSFAHKIHSVGIVLDGYKGMDDPNFNTSTTDGSSTSDPSVPFLDQDALLATPHIYFVPVGLDAMRSPPLGDQSVVRFWDVADVTVPLPFNIGASQFSSGQNFASADSLTEELFGIRKHQAFRPVATATVFNTDNGRLLPSVYTNSRLIGRSVWNSSWKIIIPGKNLLSDPEEGLDRFIRTVKDIKLYFETYSYAGN